ncbi:hypothetical protein EI613_27190 [Azospirillum sp. 412522]|nr:hypothetical protein [Azospirillum sp. 412522]MBY6265578.1 hypothetical protein [Azospirillum sp. 412522]
MLKRAGLDLGLGAPLSDGTPFDVPVALGTVHKSWLAMQARRFQRLVLEAQALLVSSEDRMLRKRCLRSEDPGDSLCDAMEAAAWVPRKSSWCNALDAALRMLDGDGVSLDATLCEVWE